MHLFKLNSLGVLGFWGFGVLLVVIFPPPIWEDLIINICLLLWLPPPLLFKSNFNLPAKGLNSGNVLTKSEL